MRLVRTGLHARRCAVLRHACTAVLIFVCVYGGWVRGAWPSVALCCCLQALQGVHAIEWHAPAAVARSPSRIRGAPFLSRAPRNMRTTCT